MGFQFISLIHNLFPEDKLFESNFKEIVRIIYMAMELLLNLIWLLLKMNTIHKLFKNKSRVLKIILDNGKYLKKILLIIVYLDDNLIYKNSETPLNSLLTKFNELIEQNDHNYCDSLMIHL